jgi:putative DNA-invertase from lambdoid prophage Rac
MSRVFLYARVSTADQTTANQLEEVKAAGFDIRSDRVASEVVSGSQAAALRPGFKALLAKMETGDVLVVTKLDRLGRSAVDVLTTVQGLEERGIRVHCLALGGADLTSAAGKLVMGVLASVAAFELDLIRERTTAGLERARSDGKKLGRPQALDAAGIAQARARKAAGDSVSAIARDLKVSRATVLRAVEV